MASWDANGDMVDDLLANHLKVGMTRMQVSELLGEEIPSDSLEHGIDVGSVPSEIDLGCYLNLEFDAAGLFRRAYITLH